MWDFLLILQNYLLWVLLCMLIALVIVICVAASISAKNPGPGYKGDDDELE